MTDNNLPALDALPIIPVGPADLDKTHSGQEPASPIGAALDLLRGFDEN